MITPVERQYVADKVYYDMLDMIIEGKWAQGEMIPSENALREAFSVSRDTVRQAIHRLRALGVLRVEHGKGTYIKKLDSSVYLNMMVPAVFLSEDDGISILEFMKAIQVESVRIVCQRANDDEIFVVGDYLELMCTSDESDYETYFNRDMDYHRYLTKLTGNSLFGKAMDITEKVLHAYLRDIVAFHGNEESIRQHEECFHAMKKRDVDNAVSIMQKHYDMLISRLRHWLSLSEDERGTATSEEK